MYASDVDEAIVVSVATVGDNSILTLDSPLKFTHLGVVLSGSDFPGDDRDTVLDMRAEVRPSALPRIILSIVHLSASSIFGILSSLASDIAIYTLPDTPAAVPGRRPVP